MRNMTNEDVLFMKDDLTILILAGGKSERLGQVKSLVKFGTEPMIKKVVDRVYPLSDEIVISSKAKVKELENIFPDLRIYGDKFEKKAPLTGLISSLPHIKRKYVAIVPCDSPKLNPEVIELLYEKAKNHSAAVPKWSSGLIEPLIAVYHVPELINVTKSAWRNKQMKLTEIIDRLKDVTYVSTEEIKKIDEELETFLNINTQEDIKNILPDNIS